MIRKLNLLFIFLIFPVVLFAQNDSTYGNFSFDVGMSSNFKGNSGFHAGIGVYSTVAFQIDYSGYWNSSGLLYHEFGPKLGIYSTQNFLKFSLSSGATVCFFKINQPNNVIKESEDLFFGIPLQIRLEFLAKRPLGFGFKIAHHFSLEERMEDLNTLTFFLSFR